MAPVNVRLNPVGFVVFLVLGLSLAFYIFGLPKWFREEERVSMREVLSVSIDLAQRGGIKVKAVAELHKLNPVSKGKTKEGKDELKTQGDLESHKAIVYGFSKAYPGMKVISEEHDTTPIDLAAVPEVNKHIKEVLDNVVSDQSIPVSQITIWIDPLDATEEYKDELYEYVTTMVCVAVRGNPVIGVIHKPFLKETAWAWVGYGHSKNLEKTSPETNAKKTPKIIASRSHPGQIEGVVHESLGTDATVTPAGGAGYKTLEVIRGHADAYIHVTAIKKWDICAGNALLSALDGKMTTINGRNIIDYSPNGSPINSEGLLATMNNHNDYLDKLEPVVSKLIEEKKAKKT
ncbi:hypothetical protein SNE40_011272 [Patella caerulea]|uniref:inositol-phosphate phosphatase n=1 Tax=Patella caerulea TaxID=87958 RepID=A0AAN8JNX4_PATCE